MATNNVLKKIHSAIEVLQKARNDEIDRIILADSTGLEKMVDESPGDISSRYWLMQFLEPLNRKELKSVVDGFLVQLLNEEQSKKLVKFLLVRFPQYYKEELHGGEKPPTLDEEGEEDHGESSVLR